MLQALNTLRVRYLLVGMGAALIEGATGTTQDLDLWFGSIDPASLSEAARREGLDRIDLVLSAEGAWVRSRTTCSRPRIRGRRRAPARPAPRKSDREQEGRESREGRGTGTPGGGARRPAGNRRSSLVDKPYPPVDYGEYLQLDKLLTSQSPKSTEAGAPAHDEMLFIVVHQAYELWFKLILHELDSVMGLFRHDSVDERSVGVAVARLERIVEIQKVLLDHLRVLETMTPLDFLEFRDLLMPASGFQSVQFRLIENRLGLRRNARAPLDRSPASARTSGRPRRSSPVRKTSLHSLRSWSFGSSGRLSWSCRASSSGSSTTPR